jgi:5-methylcytosine-specific restriction endonuclease McrA
MAVNLQGLCRSCNARKSNHLAAGTQISVFDRVAA